MSPLPKRWSFVIFLCLALAGPLTAGGTHLVVDLALGRRVEGASDDSGLFWLFASTNWELLVKVIDGCSENGHYWVLTAATTNVEYTLTVTDTQTGETFVAQNSLGRNSPAAIDTRAFGTCP